MSNPFWFPLIASFGTIILLYIIGFMAQIDILMFKISTTSIEISFLPIVVGIVIGFVSERIIKYKLKN